MGLSIAGSIVESCLRCPKYQPGEYSLSSFYTSPLSNKEIMSVIGGEQYAGETNPYPFRTDFGVYIYFQCKTDSTIEANYKPVNSLFIQSAYAFNCGDRPIFYPIDSIISIQVFSDKDFGETHLAGTDIAKFFKICEWNYATRVPSLTSFEDYLKRPAPILNGFYAIYFHCLITATNVESGEHNFRFVVKLSDERILEQSIKGVLE